MYLYWFFCHFIYNHAMKILRTLLSIILCSVFLGLIFSEAGLRRQIEELLPLEELTYTDAGTGGTGGDPPGSGQSENGKGAEIVVGVSK